MKSKLSTAKKSKTAAFSRVFTQNNLIIFLRKSKLNFWKISNSVHSSVHIEYFRITVLMKQHFYVMSMKLYLVPCTFIWACIVMQYSTISNTLQTLLEFQSYLYYQNIDQIQSKRLLVFRFYCNQNNQKLFLERRSSITFFPFYSFFQYLTFQVSELS